MFIFLFPLRIDQFGSSEYHHGFTHSSDVLKTVNLLDNFMLAKDS